MPTARVVIFNFFFIVDQINACDRVVELKCNHCIAISALLNNFCSVSCCDEFIENTQHAIITVTFFTVFVNYTFFSAVSDDNSSFILR